MIDALDRFVYDIRCGRADEGEGIVHGGWAGCRLGAGSESEAELWVYEVFVHEPNLGQPMPDQLISSVTWDDRFRDVVPVSEGFFLPPPPDRVLTDAVARELASRETPRRWWRQAGSLSLRRVDDPEWGRKPLSPWRLERLRPDRPRPGTVSSQVLQPEEPVI